MCAASAPTADDLAKKLATAKKVQTKVNAGLDPDALAAMERVYADNDGDLDKIAKMLHVVFKPRVEVRDARDFAVRMLTGTILRD